jgi:intraflagellar transport protein 52
VYANGATLNVVSPAYPILSSGPLTYPSNRPICGVYKHKNGGKLLVCGSTNMFTDDYYESE